MVTLLGVDLDSVVVCVGTNAHGLLLWARNKVMMATHIKKSVRYKRKAFRWHDAHVQEVVALLGRSASGGDAVTVWEHIWPSPICGYMAHHRVDRAPLAPGTSFIELAVLAANARDAGVAVSLSRTQFVSMLFLDDATAKPQIRLTHSGDHIQF